jgi:hypothetical protein
LAASAPLDGFARPARNPARRQPSTLDGREESELSDERSDYYVYALYAPDDHLEHPRYVGKGKGRRVIATRGRRSKRVRAWIDELGEEPFFDLIACNLTESEAFALEVETIAKYGREGIDDGGVLLNVSTGGAGAPGYKHSPEHIEKVAGSNRGRKRSPEAIEQTTAANRAYWAAMPPEERKAKMVHMSEMPSYWLGRKRPPRSAEHSAKLAAAKRGSKHSDATLAKMSAAHKSRKRSPEHLTALRANVVIMAAATRGTTWTPEKRAAIMAGHHRAKLLREAAALPLAA